MVESFFHYLEISFHRTVWLDDICSQARKLVDRLFITTDFFVCPLPCGLFHVF